MPRPGDVIPPAPTFVRISVHSLKRAGLNVISGVALSWGRSDAERCAGANYANPWRRHALPILVIGVVPLFGGSALAQEVILRSPALFSPCGCSKTPEIVVSRRADWACRASVITWAVLLIKIIELWTVKRRLCASRIG